MSWGWWALIAAAVIWVGFNWMAPLAVMAQGTRISPGRLPPELLLWRAARRVRFYTMRLDCGYGYSVWAPPFNVVVFDERFFAKASTPLLRFVVAHELAHFSFGHHRWRWLLVVAFLGLTSWAQRLYERFEREADDEAARRTGLTRSLFAGVLVPADAPAPIEPVVTTPLPQWVYECPICGKGNLHSWTGQHSGMGLPWDAPIDLTMVNSGWTPR